MAAASSRFILWMGNAPKPFLETVIPVFPKVTLFTEFITYNLPCVCYWQDSRPGVALDIVEELPIVYGMLCERYQVINFEYRSIIKYRLAGK